MKKGSTLFLKSVLVLMGLFALVVAIVVLPAIYREIPKAFAININFLKVFIAGLYLSAIPYFNALYQAFKLLNYIDKDNAFSQNSVSALKNIKYSAIANSVLYAGSIPLFFQIGGLVDPPGIRGIALTLVFVPLVIATFAAVLQKLLQNAINIKSENDLTV